MTVRELIELNSYITDLEITVRLNGTRMLDQLNIGLHEGIKPRYPTRVPISEEYIDNFAVLDREHHKDAAYVDKSINSWDDGKDYWQTKVNRIPKKWLDLEVVSWDSHPASTVGVSRRSCEGHPNINFHGERLRVNVLPSGEKLDIPEEKPKNDQIEGQMSIEEWGLA